ncbi:hypothetical protein G6F65_022673 [Rhizopus arrhizus]|nr:hypothetical protein G6F65_022673 [Rhizopus arrhizus]
MAAEELGLAQRLVDRHEHDVAQPLRQADVPAAPEVLRIERGQRIAEVDRQREAEQHADADRHRRIAGEVEEQVGAVERRVQRDARERIVVRVQRGQAVAPDQPVSHVLRFTPS